MLQYLVAGTMALENVFVPVIQPIAEIDIIPTISMTGRAQLLVIFFSCKCIFPD